MMRRTYMRQASEQDALAIYSLVGSKGWSSHSFALFLDGETDLQMVKRPGQRIAMKRRLAAGRQCRPSPASERTSGLFLWRRAIMM